MEAEAGAQSSPFLPFTPVVPRPAGDRMTRHEMNDVFARTSFLQGANASYLAELYAEYQENPSSLDPEWR